MKQNNLQRAFGQLAPEGHRHESQPRAHHKGVRGESPQTMVNPPTLGKAYPDPRILEL